MHKFSQFQSRAYAFCHKLLNTWIVPHRSSELHNLRSAKEPRHPQAGSVRRNPDHYSPSRSLHSRTRKEKKRKRPQQVHGSQNHLLMINDYNVPMSRQALITWHSLSATIAPITSVCKWCWGAQEELLDGWVVLRLANDVMDWSYPIDQLGGELLLQSNVTHAGARVSRAGSFYKSRLSTLPHNSMRAASLPVAARWYTL